MRRVLNILTIFLLMILLFSQQLPHSVAAGDNLLFVYLSRGKVNSQFRWRTLGISTEQISDVPGGVHQDVLGGNYVVFSGQNNDIVILDLIDGQQTHIGVKLEEEALLFDDIYMVINRSLIWSPDNRYLAFTGRTFEKHSDVYIYDTQTHALTNLTKDLPSTFSDAGAWSRDGHWLSFVALIDGLREPFIASLDGEIITRLTPGQGACRLIWSPDNKHLVSTTDCWVTPGDDTNLVILDFDPQHPEQSSSMRQIVSAKFGHLISRAYFAPTWYDNSAILAVRRLGPPPGINLSWSDFKTDLIFYDLTTQRERLADLLPPAIQPSESTNILDGWLYWIPANSDAQYAYNVKRKQLVDFTSLYSCRAYYLSDDGKFIAIPSGCNQNDPDTLRVFALPSRREVLSVKAKPDEGLDAVGFVEHP